MSVSREVKDTEESPIKLNAQAYSQAVPNLNLNLGSDQSIMMMLAELVAIAEYISLGVRSSSLLEKGQVDCIKYG